MYCWSDSCVVLAWLQNHPCSWSSFTGNRASEILTLLPSAICKHVRSADNLADLAMRDVSPAQLSESSFWWQAPDWLHRPHSEETDSSPEEFTTDLEVRKSNRVNVFVAQLSEDCAEWSLSRSCQKIVRSG